MSQVSAPMGFLRNSDALIHMHIPHLRQEFSQANLVSDNEKGHLSAQIQDPKLINPWGISLAPGGPFWIADNHTGTATLYTVDPGTDTTTALPLVVTIAPPAGGTGPASPTGTVFNSDPNSGFLVNGKAATFIFSTEDNDLGMERRHNDDARSRQLQ